jgi:hypothetical protein
MLTYKIYDIERNFVKNISQSSIAWIPNIEYLLDWWCWSLEIVTRDKYDIQIDQNWYFLDVVYTSPQEKSWVVVYSGVFDAFPSQKNSTINQTAYDTVWIQSLLNDILYRDWSSRAFTKTGSLEDFVQDIIDQYHAKKDHILFSVWDINDIDVTIQISNNNLFETLWKLQKASSYRFFIHPDGRIDFTKKKTSPDHRLLLDKDVTSLSIQREDRSGIKNSIIISWTQYDDLVSQAIFWFKEHAHSGTFPNMPSQVKYSDNYLLENSYPKREINCVVKWKYPIHTIVPWQTISILNTALDIRNLRVIKTILKNWEIELYVDKYNTFYSLITNN